MPNWVKEIVEEHMRSDYRVVDLAQDLKNKTAKNVKGGDSPLGKSRGILNLPSHKQGGMELFRFESQGTSLRMG